MAADNVRKFRWPLIALAVVVVIVVLRGAGGDEPQAESPVAVPVVIEDSSAARKAQALLQKPGQPADFWFDDCIRLNYRSNCTDWWREDQTQLPCQIEIIFDIALAFDQALTEAGVPHWFAFGSLLGAVRSGTIIPWTGDADVMYTGADGVPNFDFVSSRTWENLYRQGFLIYKDIRPKDAARQMGRGCMSPHHPKYQRFRKEVVGREGDYWDDYPYIDLFPGVVNHNAGLVESFIFKCAFKNWTVFPTGKIALYDKHITAPADVHKFLVQTYGPSYINPPPPKDYDRHGRAKGTCTPEWRDLA